MIFAFLFIFIFSIFLIWIFFLKIRRDHFIKTATKAFIKNEKYFSTKSIHEAYKKGNKWQKLSICCGRKTKHMKNSAPDEVHKLYNLAQEFMEKGDMLPASKNAFRALELCTKECAYFEKAKTYQLLGNIYFISEFNDLAQSMFEASYEIFAKLGARRNMSEVFNDLAKLMNKQERFEEAEIYLNNSKELNLSL